MKTGQIGILNVGAGDTRLSFDPDKPAERERAAKVVTDMLHRGYAILVQVGERDGKPLYMRAEAFDPKTCEYLIVGAPEESPVTVPAAPGPTMARSRGRKRKTLRVPAATTRSVAVARSAGG
jgi:hypothetical protein